MGLEIRPGVFRPQKKTETWRPAQRTAAYLELALGYVKISPTIMTSPQTRDRLARAHANVPMAAPKGAIQAESQRAAAAAQPLCSWRFFGSGAEITSPIQPTENRFAPPLHQGGWAMAGGTRWFTDPTQAPLILPRRPTRELRCFRGFRRS